jgi:tetratricopeptide (TPR) repeat protein
MTVSCVQARSRALLPLCLALLAALPATTSPVKAQNQRPTAAQEQAWIAAVSAGDLAYEAGDLRAAIELYTRATQIISHKYAAHRNLWVIYLTTDRAVDAMRSLQNAVTALDLVLRGRVTEVDRWEFERDRIDALQRLGETQLNAKQYVPAEATFRRLLGLKPGHLWPQVRPVPNEVGLGRALVGQGRQAEALAIYRQYDAVNAPMLGFDDRELLGHAFFEIGHYRDAARYLASTLRVFPNPRNQTFNYLWAVYGDKQWGEVLKAGERLLEMDPLNAEALTMLQEAAERTGDSRRASELARRLEAMPVRLERLLLVQEGEHVTLRGAVVGVSGTPDEPVRLEVTISHGTSGIGTQVVEIRTPARGQEVALHVKMAAGPHEARGFRYRVAP